MIRNNSVPPVLIEELLDLAVRPCRDWCSVNFGVLHFASMYLAEGTRIQTPRGRHAQSLPELFQVTAEEKVSLFPVHDVKSL